MPGELLILGGGGHAAVVAEAARAAGWLLRGFLDEDPSATLPIDGVRHLGTLDADALSEEKGLLQGAMVHAAIGNPSIRRRLLEAIPQNTCATIIHPSAVVSPSARIEAGVFIGPAAVVNAKAQIETGAIINSGAIVEHDSRVGRCAHVAPGAILAGAAEVSEEAFLGAGSVVLPGIRIGSRATLGAGSVATVDVPDDHTAVGTPAR